MPSKEGALRSMAKLTCLAASVLFFSITLGACAWYVLITGSFNATQSSALAAVVSNVASGAFAGAPTVEPPDAWVDPLPNTFGCCCSDTYA